MVNNKVAKNKVKGFMYSQRSEKKVREKDSIYLKKVVDYR